MIIILRFLFITICVMWLLRMVARLVLPMLFQGMVNKAQSQANQQYRKQSTRKPEGSIHIDFIPPKDKEAKAADKAGEFVEYEEIKGN